MAVIVNRLTNDGILITNNTFIENVVGTGSYSFDGVTQQWISAAASSDFSPGTGDFTVEWFQYFIPGGDSFPRIFSMDLSPPRFEVSEESGTLYCWLENGAAGQFNMDAYENTWVWMAISRISNVLYMFQDGKLKFAGANSSNINNSSGSLLIGLEAAEPAVSKFKGNITNFRYINGTGLYSGTFIGTTYYSIPVDPLTAVANTKLLLLANRESDMLIDYSDINRTIYNNLGVTWSGDAPNWNPIIRTTLTSTTAESFDEISLSLVDGSNIITTGLLLNLDSGNISSYPGSGSNWFDLSGNSNDFTLVNSPTYSSNNNGILIFNKNDSQFAVGPDFGGLVNFTLEAWIKFNSLPEGTVPAIITNIYDGGPFLNFSLGFDINHNNTIIGGIFNSTWYETSGIRPEIDKWYNFTTTYDSNYIKLYVNGELYSQLAANPSAITTGLGTLIGKRWDASEYIDGNISVIHIYNRSLLDTEVLDNYNSLFSRYTTVAKREMSTGVVQVSGMLDEVSGITLINDNVVTNGLTLYVDANNMLSYPGGNIWYDISGSNNDLSFINGGDITFNSTIGYFNTGNTGYFSKLSASLVPTGNDNYCIGAWIRKPSSWGNSSGIISIGGFGTGNESNALRTINNINGEFVHYWWGNDLGANASNILPSEWIYVLAQYDGSTRSVWVNGNLINSDSQGAVHNVITSDVNVARCWPSDLTLQGDIAKAFIYNRALTLEEITQNYNASRHYYLLPDIRDGLVFYYDGLGYDWPSSTLIDLTGNGNDATLVGSPEYVSDGYLGFNGSTQYGTIPTTNLIYGSAPRTLTGWAYNRSPSGYQWLWSYGSSSPDSAMFIGLNDTSFQAGGWTDDIAGGTYASETWAHWVLTYNGVVATLYIDGNLVISQNKTWNTVQNLAFIACQASNIEFWTGFIANIGLYNRVLSGSEVASLFASQRHRFGV